MNCSNKFTKMFHKVSRNCSSSEIIISILQKIENKQHTSISPFKCIYYLQFILFSLRLLFGHYALKSGQYLEYFNYDLPVANGMKLKFVDANMMLCIMLFLCFELYIECIVFIQPNRLFWPKTWELMVLNLKQVPQNSNKRQNLKGSVKVPKQMTLASFNLNSNQKFTHFKPQISMKNKLYLTIITIWADKISICCLVILSK